MNNSMPAVVLGCFQLGGLGIVRSLGRLGVPVYAADADRHTPAFFSNYCRGTFLWGLNAAPVEETIRFLKEIGQKIGERSVLITTSDIGTMLLADHADRLADWFIFPRQDARLVRSLANKKAMYHLARKWNVPAPETSFPQSRSDVLEYLQIARFPVLLKPIYSHRPGRPGRGVSIVRTERELLERYDAIEDPSEPNLIIQEYIPGGDEVTWVFNGYFDTQGVCRVAFTGRKIRNFPPYFGQASCGICLRNNEVEQTTLRFMSAIGYKGGLDLGYRYDARDGQ